MCVDCIRNEVDITEGIPKNSVLHFCRNCDRYLQPPKHWVLCSLESRELLALCLKKLKGLKEVRLISSNFIWTEPHSKRIKIKLHIQKEVILYKETIGIMMQMDLMYILGFCFYYPAADVRSRIRCC